jgi:glutaredoxin 2
MIRSAIKIILVLVAGVLIYNFFYGTDEEREQSKRIVGEFKEVGVAVKDLLQSEKEKLDEGKYDDALDKMGNLFEKVRNGVEKLDPDAISSLNRLERKRRDLEEEVHQKNEDELTNAEKDDINAEMEELLQDTERLLEEIRRDQE